MKEDFSEIKDVALMHQQIVEKISQYQNGVAAETMNKMGLNYAINYGLSLPQVDSIANAIKRNIDLAFFLWKQDERESKLLSLRLLKDFQLNDEQINEIIAGITNIELAEQAVFQLFIKGDHAYELALKLIKKDTFAQLAGFLLIARLAMIEKEKDNSVFDHFLMEIFKNRPKEKAIYLWRGIAQAFLKIGLRGDELKNKVKEIIKTINKTNTELSKYLNQEVNYFLIENN
jgi:3-methyladenine DNA glycosylase AlkD